MNKSSKHPYNGMKLTSRKPLITALEPRILLDGAALATTLEMTTDLDHQQTTTDVAKDTISPTMPDAPAPTQVKAVDPLLNNGRKEVVFIDTSVTDYQSLINGVSAGVEIELIDSSKDGLAQLTSWAQSNQDYDAIYLLSHGSSGQISLGTVSIDNTNINDYADSLATIGQSLTTDGDLLVYGCDVAKSDSGKLLINSLAQLTQADVAASTNLTGSAALGGDWSLEYTQGQIDFGVLPDSALEAYDYTLATAVDLSGKDGWTAIMYGVGKDPQGDSQAGAADTDIIGDATHGSLYTAYSDGGTPNDTSDDYLYFRMRIDNPTSTTNFNGVAIVGLDANGDGRVDLFISVDARNNTQAVRLLDPGTGLNNSPNTTTTSALPTGWLANNGMYDFTNSNFSVVAVSAATDPNWDGDTDVGNNGDNDAFISWRVPLADLTTVLAKASPTDRYGNYGPRGSTGIAGFSQDTTVSYVSFTQTQPGPINGDLNGVGKSYDKNATFAQLGAFTAPMTASDPVSASDFVRINSPISSDGLINATEDNSVAISGTASANQWVMLTVTDSTHTKTVWAQANSTGTWSLTTGTGDLSGFDEGTLTFDAKLVDANNSSTAIANASSDSVTAIHDTQAPSIEITPLATDGKPTINGISDLLAGSNIIVTIDPNGDGNLADKIMYTALVGTNGSWSVNTAVATPTSGSLPVTGLTAYAKITAEGTDTAGNTGTATAIDKPTVNSLTTQSVTPTVSGTWGGTNGGTDTLSVTVNGVTYTPTISGNTWSVVLNSSSLATGNTYDVEASVTRSSSAAVTDVTVGELTIVSGPVVIIAGSDTASTPNSKPTLSGTSTPGAVVTLQIDLDNSNSTTNDRVTYSAVADVNGNWSINTATATSISGTLPASGLSGTVGLLATVIDSNNRTATDTQTLTITVPSISIASVTGAHPVTSGISNDGILNSTEDNASVIYINTTNIATNQTIAVTVSDGVHSNVTGVASYDAVSSKWKTTLDLSSLNDGTNALNILASFNSGQVTATTQVSHDSEAYASVTSAQTTSAPDISGTADVTSSSLVIKIDRYTKQGSSISFSNTTYYSVAGGTIGSYLTASGVTLTGNVWSLPSSQSGGSFNNPGEYIFATVIGTDAAGNTVNATGQVTKIASNGIANTVSINTISGDSIINESEDNPVSISGTTTVSGGYILVTLTDGSNSISQQVQATGTSWSLSNLNLDNWKDGPIQVEAKLLSASNSTTVVASALATPTHVNSVTAAPTIAISNPIGDGNLSANEDSSVTVSGTTTNAIGSTVTVTIGGTKIGTATVASNGTWSTTFDSGHSNALSSLADGTLNVSASVTANSTTATDSTTVLHDRTPPAITITPQLTTGKPTIQGTTDLTAGSIISVTIDPDNNSGTSDTVTYQATVLNSGTWSIDLSSATPITGSLSQAGLTAYAKITATGTDAAGNSTTTTALDKPVVNTNLTNSETPTLTGTWTYISGDVLSVLVANSGNTVSHTYTAGDGHLVANSDNTWTLTIPASDTLPANTYNVTATVTRNSATASDTTSAELVVDTAAPSVEITQISNDSGSSSSDFVTNDNSLIFSGSAETDSNVLITLKDAANNTIFTTTVVASGGVWSIDRNDQTDLPDGHYTLTATATDAAGNSATDVQNIEIDTKATISITTNYKSASTTPVITGSSDLGANQSIDVTISGATYTVQTQSDGSWSIDLATANPSSGSLTPLTNANPYTITVNGSDLAGNTATANKAILIDTSAPSITITSPLDWSGNNNDTLTISEDTSVVIKGTTAKGASTTELAGSTLAITITDGNMTISDTATVLSDGSWQLAPLNLRSMASGNITVNATYIDDSGVAYTDIATILHDKTATVSIDSISSDTGIQGDFATADNTLVFSGSATPNSTVTLSLTGPSHAFSNVTVTTNGNGVWSYDYRNTTLADGAYTLSAEVGSTSSSPQTIIIDTTPPVGGVSVVAETTSNTTPTITGSVSLTDQETLSVTVNGKTYYQDDGNLSVTSTTWSLAIPATDALSPAVSGGFDGVYSITATIRDAAGNVLNDVTNNELTITAPYGTPTQTVTISSMTRDSGAADFITNDGAARSVSGSVSAPLGSNEVVQVSFDNGTTWTNATTDGTSWTVTDSGTHTSNWTLQARVTNTAASVSGSAASQLVILDTTAPATPAVASQATALTTPTLTGTATVGTGETLTVTVNDTTYTVGDGQLSLSDTQWTLVIPNSHILTPGVTYPVTATVTDTAGNTTSDITTNELMVVSIPTQTVTISSMTHDSGTADFITNDGAARSVSGSVSAPLGSNEVVQVSFDNGTTWTNATTDGTSWTVTDSGTHTSNWTLQARVTNTAASVSGSAASQLVTLDTTAPVAPTLALTTDSGSSNTDKLTNVGTLSLSGEETGALVEYSTNGTDWTDSFTPVEGTNTVYVRQTDSAGNVSAPSAAFTFVRDTTNPNNATGLLSVAERSANGTVVGIVSATDNIGPVTYSLSDNAGGRFTIDSSTGAVTVTNGTLLDDEINSSHNITVTITDAAGNQTNTVLSVAVTAVNRTPIAVNDTASAHEAGGTNNTTLGLNPSGNVLTNDLDPDSADSKQVSAILFGSNTGIVGQALDGNYGALTLLSNGNYSYVVNNALAAVQALHSNSDVLTETFTYTVQDAGGLTSTATLTITINGENDAPVVSNDSQDSSWNFGRDYYKDISTLFTDVDSYGEKLVYSISGLPAGLTFDSVSGIISGQPVNAGNFNITISATDSSGAVVSKTYALTIIAPAPTVIPVIVPTPTEIQPTPAPPVFIPIDTVEPAAPTLPSGVITSPGISETSGFIPSSADLPMTADTVANTETTTDDPALNPQKIDEGANIVSVDVNADGKVIISDIPQQANDAAGLSIKNVELSNGDIQVYIIDAKPSQNYSATLSDGTALPDWVSIDPVTGALSITPPPGEKDLVIKIYATSTDGAIRILEVKLNVEDLAKQQRVAKTSPHAEFIPLEQQFSMETATIDGYGERIASLLVV